MNILKYIRGLKNVIRKILTLLSRRQQIYLVILFVLMLLLSFIETIGISAIMPFVSVASNPELIETGIYKKVYDFFNFTSKNWFILFFGVILIVFYFFRAAYSAFYSWLQIRFALGMSRSIADRLLQLYLYIPYKLFVQKNPNEIAGVIEQSNNVSTLLLRILEICADVIMILMLYSLIVAVNWGMTFVLTGVMLVVLFGIMRILAVSKKWGIQRYDAEIMRNRTVFETLFNFKFVKLSGGEKHSLEKFDIHTRNYAHANVIITVIGNLPRNLLESVGFSLLIGAILFILWAYHSPDKVIPIIGIYALALYRILPSLHRTMANINMIFGYQHSLQVVTEMINQKTEVEDSEPVIFNKNIRIEDTTFAYMNGGNVLRDVSFKINKGDSVAITGESGGGKSTLVDIIIGIHKPDKGTLYIDDIPVTNRNIRSWRSKIGYIPQDIYLFDGSVADNIAFSSEFNEAQIVKVLKMARIWDFLCTKDGYNTRVGSDGILLSGGQKQRIGIARALYHDPEVLVLDEATSALDNETEGKIMDEIYQVSRDKTLIVIAHRLTTVERCKQKIKIENGTVMLQ